jgi:hypothetical protein
VTKICSWIDRTQLITPFVEDVSDDAEPDDLTLDHVKIIIDYIGMQIFWHGFSSVRIESQHGDQQATLITDPFEAELGLKFPRSLSPSVVALSHQQRERFR